MTASLVPTHHDRARSLRYLLAYLKQDNDLVNHTLAEIAYEPQPGPATARFVLALGDQFQAIMNRRLKDPIGYVESWIAVELQLAEDAGEPPPSQPDDVS